MEILNSRSCLLSNYEVLTLLKELENSHLERSKAAIRVKKEEEAAGHSYHHTNPLPDISENLRTIQVEAIQYLSADYLPTNSQSPNGISQLVKNLAPYDLTKAEKLQIVNLAPTIPVELYVVIEELEDRLGDSMDVILETVKSSLSTPLINGTTTTTTTAAAEELTFTSTATSLLHDPSSSAVGTTGWEDVDADAIIDDIEFVDHGEGTGIEGDLDVEDE